MSNSNLVRCGECTKRYSSLCPMRHEELVEENYDDFHDMDIVVYDYTVDDGFCDRGEREEECLSETS